MTDSRGPLRPTGAGRAVAVLVLVALAASIPLLGPSAALHGTGEAEVPGAPDGTVVRMSCWTAESAGTIAASSEIDEIAWFSYADRPRVPPVDQLLFDDLRAAGSLHL